MMRAWLAIGLALCLCGCAAFRSYDRSLLGTVEQAAAGNLDGAIRSLDAANLGPAKDLLYYLELGMLQRLDKRFAESQKSWGVAQSRILGTESSATEAVASTLRGVSSFLVNDRLRTYPGYDYEKTLLFTLMALNRLSMGEWDQARVAIKQTHELEAAIEEQRSKQVQEVEEDATKRGARTSFKDLKGYPVQTIDSPEVNALKNSYQSALAHYLAGFVYEALGEPSLAAPGYRLAIELQPGQPLLEAALSGLDERVAAPPDGLTDVLFVVETGAAPALQSRQFALPVPTVSGSVVVALAFPVVASSEAYFAPTRLAIDGREALELAPITSVDLMARRRLKDDMPQIMLRAAIRAGSRAVVQQGFNNSARGSSDSAGAGAALASLALGIGALVTEHADERTWRTLPAAISIARARLPAGSYVVSLGAGRAPVSVAGRYAVIDLRLLRNRLFVNAPILQAQSTGDVPAALEQIPQPKEVKQ